MKTMRTESLRKYLLNFLIVIFISGAIGFVFAPNFFLNFTPAVLVLTITVFLLHQPMDAKYFFVFTFIALIGYLAELIGVHTGLMFGSYYYGKSLGPHVAGVPPVIALNWALLICAGLPVLAPVSANPWLRSFSSAILITLTDVLIEQVAGTLDYWHFEGGVAGLENYAGWFVLVFVLSLLFHDTLSKGSRRIALTILGLQALHFGTIFILQLFKFV